MSYIAPLLPDNEECMRIGRSPGWREFLLYHSFLNKHCRWALELQSDGAPNADYPLLF